MAGLASPSLCCPRPRAPACPSGPLHRATQGREVPRALPELRAHLGQPGSSAAAACLPRAGSGEPGADVQPRSLGTLPSAHVETGWTALPWASGIMGNTPACGSRAEECGGRCLSVSPAGAGPLRHPCRGWASSRAGRSQAHGVAGSTRSHSQMLHLCTCSVARPHGASLWPHFSNSNCSLCVSVSHFSHSHSISNFLIIIFPW